MNLSRRPWEGLWSNRDEINLKEEERKQITCASHTMRNKRMVEEKNCQKFISLEAKGWEFNEVF